MDPRITKAEVFKTPDGKAHDSEEEAMQHLAATDYGGIIEDFITYWGDKNRYSEKHRSAIRNTLRAFMGWQRVKGFEMSEPPPKEFDDPMKV